jgi:hypothetical protein
MYYPFPGNLYAGDQDKILPGIFGKLNTVGIHKLIMVGNGQEVISMVVIPVYNIFG